LSTLGSSRDGAEASLHCWIPEPLPRQVAQRIKRLTRTEDARHVAVMPDVHFAEGVCVGVALGTEHLIYPEAVGADIGCGITTIRMNADADLLASESTASKILSALYRLVPALGHRQSCKAELPVPLSQQELSSASLAKHRERDGKLQFGTLGRGNHFLEFQADEADRVWIMVHSGSRAMGQAITGHHLRNATLASSGLRYVEADSPSGDAYVSDVGWALDYAERSRQAIIERVCEFLLESLGVEVDEETMICCQHNHVLREEHFGSRLWVHRKGAISARVDEPGVIPGSMGTWSFHVSGRGAPESLQSSSHGAGRAYSRGEARRKFSPKVLQRQMKGVWFDQRRAGRLTDEAPGAYKDISKVMRAQKELTKVVRKLRPLLSYKGT